MTVLVHRAVRCPPRADRGHPDGEGHRRGGRHLHEQRLRQRHVARSSRHPAGMHEAAHPGWRRSARCSNFASSVGRATRRARCDDHQCARAHGCLTAPCSCKPYVGRRPTGNRSVRRCPGARHRVRLTDYDFFETKGLPPFPRLIRVDTDRDALLRAPVPEIGIAADVGAVADQLARQLSRADSHGAPRAERLRTAAKEELDPPMQRLEEVLATIHLWLPNAVVVGDSTQPVYAGNFDFDTRRSGGYFNSGRPHPPGRLIRPMRMGAGRSAKAVSASSSASCVVIRVPCNP